MVDSYTVWADSAQPWQRGQSSQTLGKLSLSFPILEGPEPQRGKLLSPGHTAGKLALEPGSVVPEAWLPWCACECVCVHACSPSWDLGLPISHPDPTTGHWPGPPENWKVNSCPRRLQGWGSQQCAPHTHTHSHRAQRLPPTRGLGSHADPRSTCSHAQWSSTLREGRPQGHLQEHRAGRLFSHTRPRPPTLQAPRDRPRHTRSHSHTHHVTPSPLALLWGQFLPLLYPCTGCRTSPCPSPAPRAWTPTQPRPQSHPLCARSPGHCKLSSSISGPLPLDAISPPPGCDNHRCPQTIQASPGSRIVLE